MEEQEPLVHSWWKCKLMEPQWKTVLRFLKKFKVELPYDPAIPLLGIYPNEMKTEYQRNYLHFHVYCSIIHNSQYTYKMLFRHEKKESSAIWNNMDGP